MASECTQEYGIRIWYNLRGHGKLVDCRNAWLPTYNWRVTIRKLKTVQSTCRDGLDSFQGWILVKCHFGLYQTANAFISADGICVSDFIVHFYIAFVAINVVTVASKHTQEYEIRIWCILRGQGKQGDFKTAR